MKIYLTNALFLSFALTFPLLARGQDVCITCSPLNEHQEAQTVKQSDFHFTWLSEWHEVTTKKKCFYREVSNNGTKPLYYSWPLAGLHLNVALGPDKSDKICMVGQDNRNPATPARLYFGRRGHTTDTRVWQSTDETLQESHNSQLRSVSPLADRTGSVQNAAFENLDTSTVIEYEPLVTTLKVNISLKRFTPKTLFVHSFEPKKNAKLQS
jgi:hypothetical protein